VADGEHAPIETFRLVVGAVTRGDPTVPPVAIEAPAGAGVAIDWLLAPVWPKAVEIETWPLAAETVVDPDAARTIRARSMASRLETQPHVAVTD